MTQQQLARQKAARHLRQAANALAKAGAFGDELNQVIRLASYFETAADPHAAIERILARNSG